MTNGWSEVRTTTAEALLGMLSLRPMSGYEIRQTIEQSIGNFWRESYGQIYPTLKRLVREGLAEVVPERGKGRGSRTVYRLTADGRKRLRAWLKTPSAEQVPRNEMLLKVFFAGQISPGVARVQVEAFRERHVGELERYGEIARRMKEMHAGHPDRPYWEMTLAFGCAENEAFVRWSDRTLERLRRMEGESDAR